MRKQYTIEKTYNGFIVTFEHQSHSFLPSNIRVAKTMTEVIRIIKNNLLNQEIKLEIGEQVELKKGDVFPSVEGVNDKDVEFELK